MSKPVPDQRIEQIGYLSDFNCLADKCPDTCCSNWTINVSDENKKYYEENAPEIITDIEPNSGSDLRMKQVGGANAVQGGDCIQLKGGMCQIQSKYGETFLPDICHSFPRSYKKFKDKIYMTANLACPESLRVALYSDKKNNFASWTTLIKDRTKNSFYDFKHGDLGYLNQDEILDMYDSISKTINDKEYSSNQSIARLLLISNHLDRNEIFNWPLVKNRIFSIADKDMLLAINEDNLKNTDLKGELVNVLEAMFVLVNRDRPRYNDVVNVVKKHLGDNKTSTDLLWANYHKIKDKWTAGQERILEPILKNLIRAQISHDMFPIASYFARRYKSMINLVLEFMSVKIALMCMNYELDGEMTEKDVVDVVQPTTKRFYVRDEQEIFDFCKRINWEDYRKVITTLLNL